jgi:Site-specific recombinases, DNA invertase Pin homologs
MPRKSVKVLSNISLPLMRTPDNVERVLGQADMRRKFGYARVSTADQTLDLQVHALREAGVPDVRLFIDKGSAASVAKRKGLSAVLGLVGQGDELIVWKLDRLARSVSEAIALLKQIEDQGATLRCLTQPIDTKTAVGRLLYGVLMIVAEFERALIMERTREGLKAAQKRGQKLGAERKVTLKMERRIKRMHEAGTSPGKIGKELGISRASVYNYLPGGPLSSFEKSGRPRSR